MTRITKILAIASTALLSLVNINAQPVWVAGTPSVASTGQLSITVNYGTDREGTVYIIVFNYNNSSSQTSSYVRTNAISGPSGTIVATAVLPIKKGSTGKILQVVLNVKNPDQIHTIYMVAADGKGILQASPVRLTATTLPCPPANAGTGGNECDLNFTFNAVLSAGQGTWTKVTGPGTAAFAPNANSPKATVTVSAYGTYTFRWTVTDRTCSSSSIITVNFYRQPVANAGSGGNECDLNFALKAVPSVGTGTWTMTSGTGTASFSPNANTPSATVTVSVYGTKVFTWTEVNGTCSNSSSITVNFYQQPVANAGTGGNECDLDFTFNAVLSTGHGTWTKVTGPGSTTFTPNANSPVATVTVSEYGTYTFRWTVTDGSCSNSSIITVNYYHESFANAGNGGDECDKDFLLNAVPGAVPGIWTKVSGPGNAVFSPNSNQSNAIVTVTQSGAYDFAWTVVNNLCTSTDIIRVVFHDPPSINAGVDVAVCKGGSIQLHAVGSGLFLWTPADLLDNPIISDPIATPGVTSVFTVSLTDQWGCKNSDQVNVEVREQLVAYAGPDQVLEYLSETILEAGLGNNETGEWTVLSGTGDFTNKYYPSTHVSELSLKENIFIWTITNGVCPISSDTVNIIVHDLVIPTLITPNRDGKNDYFIIRGVESMGKTEFIVFNRWGALVYKNINYDNSWDGVDYNDHPLPEGTYFFFINPEKSKTVKGYIVIKR
jgi:gliding motility-associated-like protein